MKPVKVLIVATHPVQYAAPQYRRLAADPRVDLTVAFLSMHGAEPGLDPEFGVEVQWDVPLLDGYRWIHPRNRSARPGIRGFFSMVNPGLWSLIRRERFDIVVCFGYRAVSFWVAAIAGRVSGAGLVWTTDATSIGSRDGSQFKRRIKGITMPLLFRSGTAAMAPSTRAAAFIRSLGIPEERVFMTPYVVDNDYFAQRAFDVDSAVVRTELEIAADQVIALFVGKLVPWKRPGDLLRATARVPGVCAVMAGDGAQRAELERLASDLGIADRARFLGFQNQSQLPAIYATADVLVHPSEYEPFGLVVNEAFACGTPAIVSDECGAVGDLIVEGQTGFSFPPGDIAALTERLRQVAEDEELRRRLAEGARERIESWGPDASLEATVAAYGQIRELASGSRGMGVLGGRGAR